jgi:hypothetical protein
VNQGRGEKLRLFLPPHRSYIAVLPFIARFAEKRARFAQNRKQNRRNHNQNPMKNRCFWGYFQVLKS